MPALSGELVVFTIASVLAIGFALAMVVQKTPVRSVLSLVVTFFGLAIFSIQLAAPFIAVLQVFVYAGAILVLFLFVIMLLNLSQEAAEEDTRPVQKWLGLIAALALGGVLSGAALRAPMPKGPAPALSDEQSRLIRRVVNLAEQKRMILMLEVDQLLDLGELSELVEAVAA